MRSTHERFDGAGYPDGIGGAEIPLAARIVLVCDAFDTMTSDRPYARAQRAEAALEELWRCARTQFDPVVVAAFAAVMWERAGEPESERRAALSVPRAVGAAAG